MRKQIIFIPILLLSLFSRGQEGVIDTVRVVDLDEIVLIGKKALKHDSQIKPLSSIDEYLETSNRVTMIKRGNYAWEPAMNNMVSDRISVTIDGMQIFGACTDKMDPITSYVDISNLSEVHINSGQSGAENGATIGGGIDLKMQKNNFEDKALNGSIDLGVEGNAVARIISTELNYSNDNFFVNADASYRKADNYVAGGNREVAFSQYNKYNVSTIAGIKLTDKSSLTGAVIYDRATDIGYPALTMDVSLAEAVIGSLTYDIEQVSHFVSNWSNKVYANRITHVMDDTKRPSVPIHMDMPGWSNTYGFYSKVTAKKDKHNFHFNFNGFYNKSLAEMTMYPNDPNENEMFMLTWPDVRTLYSGIYIEDKIRFNDKNTLTFSLRNGLNKSRVADDFGLNSLRIFYPEMAAQKTRYLVNAATEYSTAVKKLEITIGAGYGQRAPSVSEAYGFYLFNSFDNYDYIGNPYLKNEKSLEFNAKLKYPLGKITLSSDAALFYMTDYIIGKTDPDLSQMTIGATGVRVYTGLDNATIMNSNLNISYRFLPRFTLDGTVGYNFGRDNEDNNLPLISPVSYGIDLKYKKDMLTVLLGMQGADAQRNYSPYYGENRTAAYTVFSADAAYNFYLGKQKLFVKAGVENIFDRYYATYADWNNIPRMGRNIFLNISYAIN